MTSVANILRSRRPGSRPRPRSRRAGPGRLPAVDRVRVDPLRRSGSPFEVVRELRAAPWNLSIGTPATDMNMPAEAGPASSIVCWVVKPSGANSLTSPSFGPSTATLSLITWAPFSSIRPPRKTPSAPVAWIFLKSDS